MIDKCPVCSTTLIKKESEANHYCPNEDCDARSSQKLIHFASRKAMNIEGLGERIIEDYYYFGYLSDIPSIYNFKSYKDDLMSLEGFGEKSINNLLTAIENSKNNSLEKLLFGLGIRHFGEKNAILLAKKFKTMDNIINLSFDDLVGINDIGDIMAKSITDYFKDEINIKMIESLKSLGLNMNYIGADTIEDSNFTGKKFVITGTISFMPREKIKEEILLRGGDVSSSVTSKTDIVIVGDDPGSKYEKAKSLNITIWNEEDLLNFLGGKNE